MVVYAQPRPYRPDLEPSYDLIADVTVLTFIEYFMNRQSVAYINLFGVFGLCFVLFGAFFIQFVMKEFPCPLCLLQRMCMLGVAFGLLLNLRNGFRPSHYGLSILSAVLGAGIATRQILLHICPKPGDHGYGSPVLGLHLYTWAPLFFIASVVAIALLLMASKQFSGAPDQIAPLVPAFITRLAILAFWLLFLLALSNTVIAFMECGFGPCADDPDHYQLLKGEWW